MSELPRHKQPKFVHHGNSFVLSGTHGKGSVPTYLDPPIWLIVLRVLLIVIVLLLIGAAITGVFIITGAHAAEYGIPNPQRQEGMSEVRWMIGMGITFLCGFVIGYTVAELTGDRQ